MKPVHVGIDPSSKKLAIYAEHGTRVIWRTYELQGQQITTRMRQAFYAASNFIGYATDQLPLDGGLDFIVYQEAPVYVKGFQSMIKQVQVGASLVTGFLEYGINPRFVPISTWKKEVVGKGNASKGDVADWLKVNHKKLSLAFSGDQDLTDAACICKYGQRVTERAESLAY